jgi:streptogrisin C
MHMARRVAKAVLAAVVIASIAGAASHHPAGAASSAHSLNTDPAQPATDAPRIAELLATTESDAQHRVDTLDEFALLTSSLRDSASAYFAGAFASHDPLFELFLDFRTGTPRSILDAVPAEVNGVTLHVRTDSVVTEREILKHEQSVIQALDAQPGLQNQFATWVDSERQLIRVVIRIQSQPGRFTMARQIKDLLDRMLPSKIEVKVSEGKVVYTADKSRGGLDIEPAGCTSGFTVVNNAGVRAMSTAGHCRSIERYFDRDLGTWEFAYGIGTPHEGQWGDLRVYQTYGVKSPSFHAQIDDIRNVEDVRLVSEMNEGDLVCHYGIATRYSCGAVDRVSTTCGDSPNRLVRVIGGERARGDSGGPWFNGTRAWGLHAGSCTVTVGGDTTVYSLFSKAVYLDNVSAYHVLRH